MTEGTPASMLVTMAHHNAWANDLIFAACADVDGRRLADVGSSYDSVLGILNHLVQVENAFYELALGRAPTWTPLDDLQALASRCARIDSAYVEYAAVAGTTDGASGSFRVPWFDFEIGRVEGVLQPLMHSHKHRADVSMLLPGLGGGGVEMDLIQWLDESRGSRDGHP